MRFPVHSSGKLSYRIRAVVKDFVAAMIVRNVMSTRTRNYSRLKNSYTFDGG